MRPDPRRPISGHFAAAAILALAVVSSAPCWAGSWVLVAPDGTPAAALAAGFDLTGPQGLQCPSDALGDKTRLQLKLQATHLKGDGLLLVGSCPADAVPALRVPADSAPHQVDLWIARPAGAGVYLGAAPGDQWRLTEPSVQAWPGQNPEVLWSPAVVPASLPDDWQPGGLLDAHAIKVGSEQRLQVFSGSLRVLLRPTAEVSRGRRDEVKAEALNASDADLDLSSSLQGPPHIWLPPVHWPIKPHQTITIRPPLASFWAGDTWTKLVFGVGGRESAVPLCLTVKPAYPAFGLFLAPGATADDLAAALNQPVSLVAAPAVLWLKAGSPHLGPEGFAYGSAVELAALAASRSAGWVRIACLWGPAPDWPAGVDALSADAAVKNAGWLLAAGPIRTAVGSQGLAADEADVAALKTCADRIACVAAAPPRLPAVAVAQARVAGADDKTSAFWSALDQSFDAAPLRAQLAAAGISRPIAWTDLGAGDGSPDARCDLSVWARAATSLLYQGATAVLARWSSPVGFPPWLDVMRELSAAVPVVSPSETPFASVRAGAPVVYRPFVRGQEGTLAVSNSSGRVTSVQCELRAEPLAGNLVRFAPGAAPVRTFQMPFRFADDAYYMGRPLVFLRLLPGETAVLNLRAVNPGSTWLRLVEEKQAVQMVGPPEQAVGRNDTWWSDMLKRGPKNRPHE
jgi:hypothetical protein